MMTCERARRMLLTRPEDPREQGLLAAHLSACERCAEARGHHQHFDEGLAAALVTEPPAWLTAAILEQVHAPAVSPWWARPRANLALQWTFYLALGGLLMLGLLVPAQALNSWPALVSSLWIQAGVVLDVLVGTWGLIPFDSFLGLLEDTQWVWEASALALVLWWLQSPSADSRRASA